MIALKIYDLEEVGVPGDDRHSSFSQKLKLENKALAKCFLDLLPQLFQATTAINFNDEEIVSFIAILSSNRDMAATPFAKRIADKLVIWIQADASSQLASWLQECTMDAFAAALVKSHSDVTDYAALIREASRVPDVKTFDFIDFANSLMLGLGKFLSNITVSLLSVRSNSTSDTQGEQITLPFALAIHCPSLFCLANAASALLGQSDASSLVMEHIPRLKAAVEKCQKQLQSFASDSLPASPDQSTQLQHEISCLLSRKVAFAMNGFKTLAFRRTLCGVEDFSAEVRICFLFSDAAWGKSGEVMPLRGSGDKWDKSSQPEGEVIEMLVRLPRDRHKHRSSRAGSFLQHCCVRQRPMRILRG